jgi:hypothetical protein
VVGTLTAEGRRALGDRRSFLEFLLRADVLRSYVHIGSTLRLVREKTGTDGSYEASVSGEHTYFTNHEHVVHYSFLFRINANGAISVSGMP